MPSKFYFNYDIQIIQYIFRIVKGSVIFLYYFLKFINLNYYMSITCKIFLNPNNNMN